MNAARALFQHAIDYAGLFPPAGLDLEHAVRNYESYRAGRDSWALGRFVLSATRLAEFVARWPAFASEWRLSVVLGAEYGAEIPAALQLGINLDAVECRPARLEHVAEIRRRLPGDVLLFIEAPLAFELGDMLAAIAEAGACAKIRTGGITPDAIPTASEVAGFLVDCAHRGLKLKATAGLHHAIRGDYPLTYEPESASARMHGFVNFFVAAAAAYGGAAIANVQSILHEERLANFKADVRICWYEQCLSVEEIENMRTNFAISFGSCSFDEPINDLRSAEWIK